MEGVRPATEADVDRLAALCRQAQAELAPGRGGAVFVAREARPSRSTPAAAALADPSQRVWAGTIDDVVVGYAVAHVEALRDGGTLGVIDDIYVEPEARGRRRGRGDDGRRCSRGSRPRAASASTPTRCPATARPRTSSRGRASPPGCSSCTIASTDDATRGVRRRHRRRRRPAAADPPRPRAGGGGVVGARRAGRGRRDAGRGGGARAGRGDRARGRVRRPASAGSSASATTTTS